jgi:hypothetical protein
MRIPGRGRLRLRSRFGTRIPILALAVILVGTALSGAVLPLSPYGAGGASPAGHDSGSRSAAQSPPPVIDYFSASPSEIFQGSGTDFIVDAYSPVGNPISYAYAGLPTGCVSANTSILWCVPTVSGPFNVTALVTDTVGMLVARAYTTLAVDPLLTEPLFTLNQNVYQPTTINFTEVGLAFGTAWSVTIGTDAQTSLSSSMAFLEQEGAYAYSVAPPPGFVASPASGAVVLNSTATVVQVSFVSAVSSTIYFNESFFNSLPFGTQWSVTLNGTTVSSTSPSIVFVEPIGSYAYTVNYVSNYAPSPQTGTVSVTGGPFGGTSVTVSFLYNGRAAYQLHFQESGLVGAPWSVLWNGTSLYTTPSNTLTLTEPNGTYTWSIPPVHGYSVAPRHGTFLMYSPYSPPISLTFKAQATYSVEFDESGLPIGSSWTVTLNGTQSSSSFGPSPILFSEPNATYTYAVASIAGYSATPSAGVDPVHGAAPAPIVIVFAPLPTWSVTFQENGLPAGTPWNVTLNGTSSPSSTTSSIVFSEPNALYSYSIGTSALASVPGFVVAPQNGYVTVSGAAVTTTVVYTRVALLTHSEAACSSVSSPPFYQNSCYQEAQSPTLLELANGTVGLAAELFTDSTSNTCPGAGAATVGRIGWSLSTDGGVTFSPSRPLGNDTCSYLNAIEPSFSVSGSHIFGAFVEENSTAFAAEYTSRATDALGFVESSDNGTTFGPVTTLSSVGNIARPVIASFGSTVYIVYENIASSTTPLPGGYLPISLEFLYSTNGGATWNGPSPLPGLNASEQDTAMSPSLAVNAAGAVSVVYATNRSCLDTGSNGTCLAYGDSIVAVTSTTNGTSWQGPTVLATGAGETMCYTGVCYSGFFESTPQVAAAYAPGGGPLYVAYSATYDQGPSAGSLNFNHTGIFVVEETAGGSTGGPVAAPSGAIALRSFNPGLAVSSSGVYLTYLQANESAGTSGLANSLSQWVATAPVGPTLAWSSPIAIDFESFVTGGSVNSTRTAFPGFSSSITFDPLGNPLIAFALPGPPSTTTAHAPSYYYVNTTYPTAVVVGALAIPGAPNTVSVTFTESGFPSGRAWQFELDGITFALTTPSIEFTNIPLGLPQLVGATYQPGYWEIVSNEFPATFQTYSASGPQVLFFQVWEGLEFNTMPSGILPWMPVCCGNTVNIVGTTLFSPFGASAQGDWQQYNYYYPIGVTYSFLSYSGFSFTSNFSVSWSNECVNTVCGYETPWYFPYGSTMDLDINQFSYNSWAPTYWSGAGAGSYTGEGQGYCYDSYDCDLTSGYISMFGPINETLWWDNGPTNLVTNVTFTAAGLPSTSQYYVTLDSSNLTGNLNTPAVASYVAPGAHTVSNVWATSSQPGWEYFGSVVGPNPIVTPIDSGVTLSFASLVNLSAPVGTVSFQATNLAVGTTWAITFNNTVYSASVPWINVTTRPGTFQVSADTAVSTSGTTGYVPEIGAENISVATGGTYMIPYVPAYELLVTASAGGFVSVQGGSLQSQVTVWEAAGSPVDLKAMPTSGYLFIGWNGTGPGSYSGTSTGPSITVSGPIVETAGFFPLPGARFNLTLAESGLPEGAWWTVVLNGTGHSSDAQSVTVGNLWPWSAGPAGVYPLAVPTVYLNSTNLTRFVPLAPPPVVGTNGSSTPPIFITYSTQYYLQLTSGAGGDAMATYQNLPLGTSAWLDADSLVTLTAIANAGYTFAGWQGTGSGSYTGPNSAEQISVNGAIREVALFTVVVQPPPPTYTLVIDLTTPVESGTVWGVTFGGVGHTSSGVTLTISGLSTGLYTMLVTTVTSPDGTVQYRATPTDPVAYTVSQNATIDVALAPYYWVDVSASAGGSVTPGPGYFAFESILYLTATTNSGYSFGGWSGSGPGAYQGTNATAAIIVTAPLSEVAEFHPSGGASAGTSVWSSPETWLGIGAVGLVIGLVVGYIFVRVVPDRRPPLTSPPPKTPENGANGGNR